MRRALCTASAPTRVQTAVIGAGVVGLATARALALAGHEVIILESGPAEGTGTSSRNSEVVHAGIYYEEGSLKAQTCVAGRRMLYDFCDAHGVEYKRCGKLLVATSQDEVPMLDAIAEKARRCGLVDEDEALRRLSVAEVEAYEPNVSCVGALLSPSTGIVDSHSLMVALLGGAESAGATLAVGSRVTGARVLHGDGRLLLHTTADDGESMALDCNHVVNAAGHGAPAIARLLEGAPPQHEEVVPPQAYYAKGNYFGLSCASPFRGLVYPLPQQAGLGVHATVDLGGRCRFGPDVQWVSSDADFQVDPKRAEAFYAEVRKYWPALPDGALVPDYAGIRPKLQGPGEPSRDFLLLNEADHGVHGLVHLLGIESPGLTASLALAELCVDALGGDARAP